MVVQTGRRGGALIVRRGFGGDAAPEEGSLLDELDADARCPVPDPTT